MPFVRLALLACISFHGVSGAQTPRPEAKGEGTETLDTPSCSVQIQVNCHEEGSVTCDDVTYRGVNKRTKKVLKLAGRTHHKICADDTPCRLLGYLFRSGPYTYFVSREGELSVRKGENLLVQESGVWQ